MIRIILVEDEPSAMKYLCSVIEQKCTGFEIIDTAENGAEGLEKARLHKPDVIITDIKMPVMDGIRLVSRIKEELPYIYSVIISGYQDFEYAKGAIQSGVVDYLLKPVNAVQLRDLLHSIREKLKEQYRAERLVILKQALTGAPVESWRLSRYFPYERFIAALIRVNSLPSRFTSKLFSAAYDPALGLFELSGIQGDERIWVIPGRDEMEMIFFHTPGSAGEYPFHSHVFEAVGKITGGYHHIVFSTEFSGLRNSKRIISGLYRTLDNNLVIGLNQIFYENMPILGAKNKNTLDVSLWNKLNFFLSNGQYDELKQEFIKLFASWEKAQCTQLWVESNLRQILNYIEKHSPTNIEMQHQDMEFLLDEALFYAASFGDLLANVWEIVEKLIQRTDIKNHKVDNPAFFSSIELYVGKNITEPLTLQRICTVFGISQTYLSRLFRKYRNMSFIEYLTNIRMDKAKQLIEEYPEMHLKDVAEAVGYIDPFYFSRVFRMTTGVPPSEYMSGK